MVQTESIRSMARQATLIVTAHTVLLILYSYSHEKIDLLYPMSIFMPLLLILCLGPLLAALFLSTSSARQGAVALLGVLPAELIYNIVTRFTGLSPITREETKLIWKILYEGSFGLILILEVIGFWLTFKILREIHKQINLPSKNQPEEQLPS
jgi:hypothetical protein